MKTRTPQLNEPSEHTAMKEHSHFAIPFVHNSPARDVVSGLLRGGVWAVFCWCLLLRGTTVNRTCGAHENLHIYFPVFTDNFWSYLLWPPRNNSTLGPFLIIFSEHY